MRRQCVQRGRGVKQRRVRREGVVPIEEGRGFAVYLFADAEDGGVDSWRRVVVRGGRRSWGGGRGGTAVDGLVGGGRW